VPGAARSGQPPVGTVGGVSAEPPRAGEHPLATMITDAAAGRFPEPDGGWQRVPPWRPGLEAIFSFTAHAVLAVAPDVSVQRVAALGVHGFRGAHDPRLIAALAGPEGWIDSLDMLMAARGTGRPGVPPRLVDRRDLVTHPRARLAARLRDEPRVLGCPDPRRSPPPTPSPGLARPSPPGLPPGPGARRPGGRT